MYEYKCGHKSEIVILDGNPMSVSAYLEWAETVGVNGSRSQCWECWCKGRGDLAKRLEETEKTMIEANRLYQKSNEVFSKELERLAEAVKSGHRSIVDLQNERNQYRQRIELARNELVRLCAFNGGIVACNGMCAKQDSNPCEYHDLWLSLGPMESEMSIWCPQHGIYFVDGVCPECEEEK